MTHSREKTARNRSQAEGGLGLFKEELPTPALLLDMDLFESNLKKMAEHARVTGINLRPHAKSHKCPEIARRQIEAGAVGVCTATIREAEALAAAGVTGVLITSEMVGRDRIGRLVRLARDYPDTISVVDDPVHAEQLSDAALSGDVNLNVLIDLDLGLRRTGVAGVDEGLALAEKITRLPNLRLLGVNAYSSLSAHVFGFPERRAHSLKAMRPAEELYSRLKELGMRVEILSGGSTGTYNIDTELEAVTELQAGSYIFMDVDYYMIGNRSGSAFDDFRQSLTVLATVVSKNHSGFATVDAGFKAFATDRPFGPKLKDIAGVEYHFAGDEHGILELKQAAVDVRLGDRLEFIVPHCDPTVNLYDRMYCIRGDEVEAVWPIARGYDR